MSADPIRAFNKQALDPAANVVIEACAGSGKTWLLVSRIVRLLLENVPPSEILAVTFTRKAAQEMAARLREWLFLLATGDRETVRRFLVDREVPEERLDTLFARSRLLYERLLTAQPGITITTFHSWFMQVLRRAPLDAGVPGDVALAEQTAALVDEAWQRFASGAQAEPASAAARGLDVLFRDCGLENTRRLLTNFLRRRAEWWAYTRGAKHPVAHALARIEADMEITPDADVLGPLFADGRFGAALADYSALLARNSAGDQRLAAALDEAQEEPDARQRYEELCAVFFTATGGTLRKRKASGAQAGRLGDEGERRFLVLHAELGARLANARDALTAQDNYRFNEAAFSCGVALLECYQAVKAERQVIDYGDIEWRAWELVRVSEHAAYMHCKLDARYRHILVDEFQDTNPLQWLTLQSWLEAADAADSRPTVFMVGDPKQSIYRFRRAEARLFARAQDYLREEFGARRLAQNTSRRCAPAVLEVVNRLFAGEPRFSGFNAHEAHFGARQGRVEVLALATAGQGAEPAAAAEGLRNPLSTPLAVEDDRRRQREAEMLTARIGEIVGHWQVHDEREQRTRPARRSDIMLLVRRRTHLAVYERALRHADVPYVTSRQGGLLDTLEAQDLIALLEFLTAPYIDLKLAHALRSPVFGAQDEDLVAIAQAGEGTWWERLGRLVERGGASATLARAHGLLSRWLASADALPVHDQLDRIYFEGEVMRRYAEAVPVAMKNAVAANLNAFIERALDTDAGRYPSLPRFIHELADLAAAPPEEAPDEGIAGDAGDAVRIYTVHGAKGLEAPIVWLLDAAAGTDPSRGYDALVDWPTQSEQPAQFSLWARRETQSSAQQALAAAEAELGAREDLNLLYVAMTRAAQALIVSGSDGRGRAGSWYEKIRAATLRAAGRDDDDPTKSVAHGDTLAVPGGAGSHPPQSPRPQPVDARLRLPLPTGRRVAGPSGRGLEYGTQFHLLMERLTVGANPDRAEVARSLGLTERELAPLWSDAQRLLADARLAPFFDPARYVRALNEVSFVGDAGEVKRIDRLVETGSEVWVLDYKTGDVPQDGELLDEYEAQISEYRLAVARMFPGKPVRAMLVFAGGAAREVDA